MKAIIFVLLAFIAYASAHICRAEGDPHYRTFGGHGFNFYSTGEYVFFSRHGFNCQTRLRQSNRHWQGRSLNVGIACQYNGVHFEIDVEHGVKKYFNHQNLSGVKKIRGVEAKAQGNNFSFKANGMEVRGNINRIPSGNVSNYLNLYVYSHHAGASGLCVGQKTQAKRSLFHHGKAPKVHHGKRKRLNKNWVKIAQGICKKHFKVGSFSYKSCVYDIASEKRKRIGKQYARFSRVIRGKFKKVCNAHRCHYFKRVTHVKYINYKRHHWTSRRVVDHKKRSWASRRASFHRNAINKISRKRYSDIQKVHQTANKNISGIRRQIQIINNEYNKKVQASVAKRQRAIKRAMSSFQQTVSNMNVWKNKVRSHAISKRNAQINKWNSWKNQQINKASRTVVKKINAINAWKSKRFAYASRHHQKVINRKRKWYNTKVAFARRLHQSTVRRLASIRKYKIKQLNCQLSAINMRRHEEISQLHDDANHAIRYHQNQFNRHYRISRSATRIVRKRHTTHHRRKVVRHSWKLFHSHK